MQGSIVQVESGSGCQLQEARRCRGLTSDECEMNQDICDISLWLMVKFQIPFAPLWIDRHHFQRGRELANVTVMLWRDYPDFLTPTVQETFVVLGYRFIDTGEAVRRRQSCDGTHSKHDTLRAYVRIETALCLQKARRI
tara:strand:+ start:311 stop:727 length:417 start_codon:yes stop_codon:yes gene_type:complete